MLQSNTDESLSDKSRNDISKKLLTYKERGEIIHKKLIQREEDNVSTNTTEEMHSSTSRRFAYY